MALSHGPPIVTNGLVLALDAADRNSYPGSGTTWTDLSGRGNTGTLTNGPTYSSSNGGSIMFDGVDDYVSEANFSTSITNSFTISFWVNFTNPSSPTNQKIFHVQVGSNVPEVNLDNYNGGSGSPKIHFYTAATSSSNNIMTSGENIISNTWYHIAGVYDDNSYFKYLYVNSVLKNSGSTAVKISWPNTVSRIGYRSNNTEPFNGRIAQASIYNRALSASEVQQNFNALRGRFNI